jgi:hypothetical protein
MSVPPGVVEVDGFTIESSRSTAAEMIQALSSKKKNDGGEGGEPREVKPKGQEKDEPKSKLAEAASELGKEGGKAAAKARAVAEKDKASKAAPAKEAKPAETAESASAEGDDAEEADAAVAERKSRAQQRVEQATRDAAEARRELARERTERERVSRELAEERRTRQAGAGTENRPEERRAPAAPTAEPQLEEYLAKHPGQEAKAISAWVSDRDTWRDDQRQKEATQRQEAEQHVRSIDENVQGFKERLNKVAEADEGYKERTSRPQPLFDGRSIPEVLQPSFTLPRDEQGNMVGLEGRHVAADEVIKSSLGPEMIDHFSEHPAELQRIAALRTPDEIIRAMAKLEARLEDATAGATSSDERPGSNPEISKARPPARPVAVSPRIANAEPSDDSSFDEHERFYNARDKERRRKALSGN